MIREIRRLFMTHHKMLLNFIRRIAFEKFFLVFMFCYFFFFYFFLFQQSIRLHCHEVYLNRPILGSTVANFSIFGKESYRIYTIFYLQSKTHYMKMKCKETMGKKRWRNNSQNVDGISTRIFNRCAILFICLRFPTPFSFLIWNVSYFIFYLSEKAN